MNPRTLTALLLSALMSLLLGGCAISQDDDHHAGGSVATLREYMTGSFTTAKQAAADPQNVRDIRLEVVPIWTDRNDGAWLYIEQAVAGSFDKPYRQRIYRLTENADHTFTAAVFALPEPAQRFAGAHRDSAKLAALAPAHLEHKSGCDMVITWHHCREIFSGSTTGTGCESSLNGAAYATSEVSISPYGLIIWDRGFDNSGRQVWGPTTDGYAFIKTSTP